MTIIHDRSFYRGTKQKIEELPHLGTPGTWGIGGFKLPDFGITEALSGGGKTFQNPQIKYADTAPKYNPPAPTKAVLPAKTQNNYSTGGGGYNVPTSVPQNNQQPYQQIQQAQDNGNAQIDADYNAAMGQLSNAESGLRSQAANAGGVIDTGFSDVSNQIQNEQGTAEAGIASNIQTAQTQAKSANMQARDVFRQTQQSNNAQLSALGLSSSSVSEALAERLGVETARRIAGVTDNLNQVQLNAQQELGRVKTYYQGQLTTLQKNVADQKASIQSALIQGLNQINSARDQASSAKAAARANLLSQVQNQIYSLTQQQQQFQQSLDQWVAQKNAALRPVAQDPNYVNNLIATAQQFNQQFAPSGFQYMPEVNVNAQGNYTGQITPQKVGNTEDDDYAAIKSSLGIK